MAVGPVGQIHISVTDLDRAIGFYRDVLGIPMLFRVPGQPMAFFQSGGVRLYLGVPESPAFRSTALVYFTVEDIDAEYARLADAGVAVAEPPHVVHRDGRTELWMASFADPDGQNLALMQERPCPN
ncbi:MAG TPA: VOC family protein [Actinophytocola sp.]|uniref:VOC family protein n=1 Tax=Actinophytocola sp. TaxID=1872138 RepID=UPI002DDCC281|nr:VOC family protein [Actinophytocola sp.]HEV2780777.1 VOC family protein [Actinophytocola sp.]